MFPGAGGQYRYISELSSPRYRSPLAFFTGYFTLMGWTALTASAPYASANLIQGLISLSDPSYEPTRWKTTLIYMCILIMAFVFNQWFSKMLPMLEQFIMAVHILFWVGILIAVCVLPETRNSAGFVFGSEAAVNLTGWDNDGVAWCLGLLTSAYILVGEFGGPILLLFLLLAVLTTKTITDKPPQATTAQRISPKRSPTPVSACLALWSAPS